MVLLSLRIFLLLVSRYTFPSGVDVGTRGSVIIRGENNGSYLPAGLVREGAYTQDVLKGDCGMQQRSLVSMVLVMVVIAALGWSAEAATISGTTGLINIPSADALPSQSMEAAAHVFGDEAVISVGFGIVPQVELGVSTAGRHDSLKVTLKGVVTPETREAPGIAVGLDGSSAYLVFSRGLDGARGHIGFGNGRFGGLFGGFSVLLNPVTVQRGKTSPATTLMIEHDGRGVNAGVRIGFTPQLKMDLAFLNMEEAMLGLAYTSRF